ncbi:MAG: hypothetical protein WD894_12375 [Pirellulales bacterium]
MLDREEYIEQAYLFRVLGERMNSGMATQELLALVKEEVLSTTKLPLAIDFLASELRHVGTFSSAMARLSHYFTPFQTFVAAEAENERGRFDLNVALKILEREALYRGENPLPQGIFLYQFECLSRNRLGYDKGLEAVARDPVFDDAWREWILIVRRQVGIVDFGDMVYVRSQQFIKDRLRKNPDARPLEKPALFGEKEGRIAWANRGKDPLLLFAALHRQLGYPSVPKPVPIDETPLILPQVLRRVERMESRLKLLEEEQKGGIDLSKFYNPGKLPPEV